MTRTWGDPPPPTAFDHPYLVAEYDTRNRVQRCSTGCVAIEDALGESSDTDSHSFVCHGCGGNVCIGCRCTPVVDGATFCTPCNNAHDTMFAGMVVDEEEFEGPSQEPLTVGQLQALLAGVGDDIPLRAIRERGLKSPRKEYEIVIARQTLRDTSAGAQVQFGLVLRRR